MSSSEKLKQSELHKKEIYGPTLGHWHYALRKKSEHWLDFSAHSKSMSKSNSSTFCRKFENPVFEFFHILILQFGMKNFMTFNFMGSVFSGRPRFPKNTIGYSAYATVLPHNTTTQLSLKKPENTCASALTCRERPAMPPITWQELPKVYWKQLIQIE